MRSRTMAGVFFIALGSAAPHAMAETKISGFSDVTFESTNASHKDPSTNEKVNDKTSQFFLGDIDIFLASSLGDNFSWLSESVFAAGGDNNSVLDVERLLVKYSPSDLFNVSVGRFHTALGYWNDTYHHGRWFQTPITRPSVYLFEDEGGILPVHSVGVEIRGLFKSRFGYIFNLANGRGPTSDLVQINHDADSQKAINLLLYYNTPLDGLRIGAGLYKDFIPENKTPLNPDGSGFALHGKASESIVDAHLVYKAHQVEFLNEYHQITHLYKANPSNGFTDNTVKTTTKITAIYSQLAYTLRDVYSPYFRYESITGDADNSDPYLAVAKGLKHGTNILGVRFDASDTVSLKAEVAQDSQKSDADPDASTVSAYRANVCWAF